MEIKVPSVGESVTEVTVAEWLKPVGAFVEVDEPIVLVESDKADMEIPAPASGTLTEQRIGAGEDAAVGDVLGTLEPGEAPAAGSSEPASEPATAAEPQPSGHVMPAAARAAHGAAAAKNGAAEALAFGGAQQPHCSTCNRIGAGRTCERAQPSVSRRRTASSTRHSPERLRLERRGMIVIVTIIPLLTRLAYSDRDERNIYCTLGRNKFGN